MKFILFRGGVIIPEYSKDYCAEIFKKEFFISEDDPLRNGFLDIINNYRKYWYCVKENNEIRLENRPDNDLSSFVSSIFPKVIENIIDNEEGIYDVHGSKYIIQNFTEFPWIAITDSRFDTIKKGYYIVYLFDKYLSRIYLSLCFGMQEFTNNQKYIPKKNWNDVIEFKSQFKNKVNELYDFNEEKFNLNKFADKPDLNAEGNKKAISYELCTIYSKYYNAKNLPSEEILKRDLLEIMELYKFTKENEIFEFVKNNEPEIREDENMDKNNFYKYLLSKGFYFKEELIENYLLSLKVKPFIILTGNSGTGKTKLSQLFAEFISDDVVRDELYKKLNKSSFENIPEVEIRKNYKNELLSYVDEHYNCQIVPVGANWTDNRNIVGYNNLILNMYQHTPASILIKLSNHFLNHPFFLILDEMNLSHVERYFSDYLSSIESGMEIPLYGTSEKIKIPHNLFTIGTVNVDETTYMFSPKVLDRANVIEFETTPIKEYLSIIESINDESKECHVWGDLSFLLNPINEFEFPFSDKKYIHELDFSDLKNILETVSVGDSNLWIILNDELDKFHVDLKKSGFDFGFRVYNEILRFMVGAWYYEKDLEEFRWKRYFDAQIKQKILPKLHGSILDLDETLEKLLVNCLGSGVPIPNNEDEIENNDKVKYPSSSKKLFNMRKTLNKKRYVSFI